MWYWGLRGVRERVIIVIACYAVSKFVKIMLQLSVGTFVVALHPAVQYFDRKG